MKLRNMTRIGLQRVLAMAGMVGTLTLPMSGARADNGDFAYYQYGDWGYNIVNMPSLDQRRDYAPGIIGLPNKGAMYCVPTSSMNTLAYIANHGFPNVFPGPGDWQANNFGQYNGMSIALILLGLQMGTDPIKGTSGNGALSGVENYIDPSQFTVDNIYALNNYCPTLKDLTVMAIQGRLVNLGVGWYSNPDTSMAHQRSGGHAVTMVNAENTPLGPGEAMVGIQDPARDKDLFSQSTYTTTDWNTYDVTGVFDGSIRTQTRMMNYGSGYIDSAMVITPKVAFAGIDTQIYMLAPIVLFYAEKHIPVKRLASADGSKIADIALDPISGRSPYIMTGHDGVYEIDHLTGETTLLPAVQRDAAGRPLPLQPRQIQLGGPERKLFVLQNRQLTRLSRDGKVEIGVPLREPLCSIRYDQKLDRLFGYASNGHLYQWTADLKLVGLDSLSRLIKPGSCHMADDPRTGNLIMMCDGSVRTADGSVFVYDLAFRDGHVAETRRVQLEGANAPVGLDVDEAGVLFVSDSGKIAAYDLNGRKVERNPFNGMPGGQYVHIIRGFNNFDPAVHSGPGYYNVLPENSIKR